MSAGHRLLRNGKILTVVTPNETLEDEQFVDTSSPAATTNMDQQLKDALLQLAKAQQDAVARQEEFNKMMLDTQQAMANARVSEKRSAVQRVCAATIVKFEQKYIQNFLSSVENTYDSYDDDEEKVQVLTWAKNRVTGNAMVNAGSFDTYENFKLAVNQAFKPTKCLRTLEREVDRLKQNKDESVDNFAKRTMELNVVYAEAFTADRCARNREVDPEDLADLERKVIDCFISGLKERLQPFIEGEPDSFKSMQEALGAAIKAEAALMNLTGGCDDSKPHENQDKKQNEGKQQKGKFFKNGKFSKGKKLPSGSKSDDKPRLCYICKEPGHYANACPKKEAEKQPEAARSINLSADNSKNGVASAGPSGSAHVIRASRQH